MINRDLVKSGSTDEPNARKDGKKGRREEEAQTHNRSSSFEVLLTFRSDSMG